MQRCRCADGERDREPREPGALQDPAQRTRLAASCSGCRSPARPGWCRRPCTGTSTSRSGSRCWTGSWRWSWTDVSRCSALASQRWCRRARPTRGGIQEQARRGSSTSSGPPGRRELLRDVLRSGLRGSLRRSRAAAAAAGRRIIPALGDGRRRTADRGAAPAHGPPPAAGQSPRIPRSLSALRVPLSAAGDSEPLPDAGRSRLPAPAKTRASS